MIKKIIYISLILTPFIAFAITGENARFDFTSGQPDIIDDTSNTCNNQAVVRFDFTNGQPHEVYDTTATCTISISTAILPTPRLVNLGKMINNSKMILPH